MGRAKSQHQLALEQAISQSYATTHSIYKTGRELGISPQRVYATLVRLGENKHLNVFSSTDQQILVREYHTYANSGQLDQLAIRLHRTKQFLCRQARKLGLTNQFRSKPYIATWRYMPIDEARQWLKKIQAAPSSQTIEEWCIEQCVDDLGLSRTLHKYFPAEWESLCESHSASNPKYAIGRKIEYDVCDALRAAGYSVVMRSYLSKSPVDLMAAQLGSLLFVQCAKNMAVAVPKWNALYELSSSVQCKAIIAGNPTGTQLVFMEILDQKTGQKQPQPWKTFLIQQLPLTGDTHGAKTDLSESAEAVRSEVQDPA